MQQTVIVAGQTYSVPERVVRMIAYLARKAERIGKQEKVKVTFNCAGGVIRSEVVETEDC